MDKHFDALDSQRKYVFGETLRETIGSVLDQLGKDWSDVLGMALRLHESYYQGDLLDFVDPVNGNVKPSMIPEILDIPASKLFGNKTWGCDSGLTSGVFFSSTIWLDDAIILFSNRYDNGDYVACEVFPTAPGPTYAFEASSDAPSP